MADLYVQDKSGTYIPATQRPDGTWRKARRVRDGYVPQDEMPLYVSKGKQWAKNKPTLPIGLNLCSDTKSVIATGNNSLKTIPGLVESEGSSKSSKKKKKKRNDAQKEQNLISSLEKVQISPEVLVSKCTSNGISSSGKKTQPVTTDPTKRIRNLKKKLRDIDSLKQKIESGELENPEKDQLEKISRRDEISTEIEELEFELENA